MITDRPVTVFDRDGLRTSAAFQAINHVNVLRSRCGDHTAYKQYLADLMSAYIALDAVCCRVISGGLRNSWESVSTDLLYDPDDEIMSVINTFANIGGDPL